MALVNDDEVEEVRGVFLVQAGPTFILGNRLINAEVQFSALGRDPVLNLRFGIAERGKRLVFGVIDKDVPV